MSNQIPDFSVSNSLMPAYHNTTIKYRKKIHPHVISFPLLELGARKSEKRLGNSKIFKRRNVF